MNLPVKITGVLHNVKLINFTVDPEELKPYLPEQIKPRLFEGKALVSMVDVQLKRMQVKGLPRLFSFQYRHVGFRLLVDDSAYENEQYKGLFFLRSFTDKWWAALGGNMFTNFRLTPARIKTTGKGATIIEQNRKTICYQTDNRYAAQQPGWLKESLLRLDRAYSVTHGNVEYVLIEREKWPIEWVNCTGFKTSFFKTAQFAGAMKLPADLDYTWLAAQKVNV